MPSINPRTLADLRRKLPEYVGVESRCVGSHDFTMTTEELAMGDVTIVFVGPPGGGSGTYVYHDVPLTEYVDFSQAGSLGTYFNLYIKDRFPYERIA